MSYHEILRIVVLACSGIFAILCAMLVWKWHTEPDGFDLRDLLMSLGKDKKQHLSRVAVAEMVALCATTSGYLGALAAKPDLYVEATAVYGGIWAVRGGFSQLMKSKTK